MSWRFCPFLVHSGGLSAVLRNVWARGLHRPANPTDGCTPRLMRRCGAINLQIMGAAVAAAAALTDLARTFSFFQACLQNLYFLDFYKIFSCRSHLTWTFYHIAITATVDYSLIHLAEQPTQLSTSPSFCKHQSDFFPICTRWVNQVSTGNNYTGDYYSLS